MDELYKHQFVTKEEVDQSKLDVQTATNELKTAELEAEILKKYTHPMRLKKLEGDRKQAQEELERFRVVAERRKIQTEAAAKQNRQARARVQRQLTEAYERRDKMTMRAPGNGIVVYGSGRRRWRGSTDEIKVGSNAHRNQVLMRLPDLESMEVVIRTHEADINKIRPKGDEPQVVTITTDSLPGRRFEGVVKRLGALAQSDWGSQYVKWFETIIALNKQIPSIRPGMTAKVEILVDELKDILYVPIQMVETRRGKSYCYAVVDGKVERRAVTIGASNNSFVEIKKGLKEGGVVTVKPDMGSDEAQEEKSPKAPRTRRRPRGTRGAR